NKESSLIAALAGIYLLGIALAAAAPWSAAAAADNGPNAVLEPESASEFKGKIGISVKDSVPDWPEPIKAPAGAPNIIVVLLDDIGFADTSTFGGLAQTPALDKLAGNGLRYNNFHTTAMCSPTRAALLTGRNHHRAGFG